MKTTSMGARALLAAILISVTASNARSACTFDTQGEGRVGAVVDVRTFRFQDDREIRLAEIEPPPGQNNSPASLSALIGERDVHLRGPDDAPDRYGRQVSFVFTGNSETPVQVELLARGQALFSGLIADKACAADLANAEASARHTRQGLWRDATAIKNAERPDDILAVAGQFAVVEGKVLSAREAGSTFYVNFSRRWKEGFAATASKRILGTLEAAGVAPKSLENRRIRIRGWVEQRGGPRIEIFGPGQIEVVGEK